MFRLEIIQRPYFPETELLAFHERLQGVKLHCANFTTLLKRYLQHPDLDKMVFYCDPPYAPLSKTAHFTGYAAHKFTLEDQAALAKLAAALMRKEQVCVLVIMTLPLHAKSMITAYSIRSDVSRSISCQGQTRRKVKELIALYHR